MAVSASAKVLNPADGDDKYLYEIVTETANNLPEGKTLADVYGFSFKVDKLAGEGETCVGAFAWQSDSVNWEQEEFCQEGGDKNIFIGSDGTVKLLKDSALFAAGDTWAKAFVAEWSWDGDAQIDFTVSDFTLLGQDGNALSGAAAEETKAPEETQAPTEETKAADNAGSVVDDTTGKQDQPGTKTGDAGVAVAVAGLSLAGAAAFVARKRK